jgi:hypothetical protein
MTTSGWERSREGIQVEGEGEGEGERGPLSGALATLAGCTGYTGYYDDGMIAACIAGRSPELL